MGHVKHSTGHFTAKDGTILYYQDWRVLNPRAILIFLHGLSDHLGRYKDTIHYFVQHGYDGYIYDHRGHGRSAGPKGYVKSFDQFVDDLKTFCKFVREKEKGSKIFLIGHSMGGQIVLDYGFKYKDDVAGIVALSPNVKVAIKIPALKLALAKAAAGIMPHLMLASEISPSDISRDPKVAYEYENDPMVQKKVSLKLITEMFKDQGRLIEKMDGFNFPLLLMHAGGDKICDPEAAKSFFEKLGLKDKTLKIYPECYHELFNEPVKEDIFKEMEVWIEERL